MPSVFQARDESLYFMDTWWHLFSPFPNPAPSRINLWSAQAQPEFLSELTCKSQHGPLQVTSFGKVRSVFNFPSQVILYILTLSNPIHKGLAHQEKEFFTPRACSVAFPGLSVVGNCVGLIQRLSLTQAREKTSHHLQNKTGCDSGINGALGFVLAGWVIGSCSTKPQQR